MSMFLSVLRSVGIPAPQEEHQFCPGRKWRVDYYWPETPRGPLALEAEGGVYTKGAHGSITGILRDMEKYNALTEQGIWLVRFRPEQLLGEGVKWLERWFAETEETE